MKYKRCLFPPQPFQCITYDPPGLSLVGDWVTRQYVPKFELLIKRTILYSVFPQATIILNGSYIKPDESIYLYAYKTGCGIVPKTSNIYGSAFKIMRADSMFGVSQSFDIKRKEISAIDQETKRCSYEAAEGELTRCISRYVDGRLNCSSRSELVL